MPQVIVIPFTGQEIGQGFNSETRESLGTGLSVASISEDKVADGQTVFTAFQMVTDQESMMKALGVSASLGARYMLFSADAKVSLAEDHAVNSYSSFIVGRCLVKNAQRHGHGFKLSDDAQPLVTALRMGEFKTAFGDMFVRSLNTGGEFLVISRITSIDEEQQRKLALSLNAEYNGFFVDVKFSAAYQQATQMTHNHTEVQVWTIQSGGIGAQASFTGPDAVKILQHLSDFPTIAHEHPVGYEAELATYNTIPIPIPTAEEREDREIVLADCAQQKIGFLRALSNLDLALDENGSQLFEGLPSNDDLIRMKGQYRTALNGLISHAIRVATGKMDPPQLFVANPAPPAINFKKKHSVPASAASLLSQWQSGASMSTPRRGLAAVTGPDGRIYAIGGSLGDPDPFKTVEAYDPQTKSWTPVASMSTPRYSPAAVTGPDGRIYALGGQDGGESSQTITVEAYDPKTNTWTPVASMSHQRDEFAAVLGPDGRIYAIGGQDGASGGDWTNEVEAYDPKTNTWTRVASMSTPRFGHAAALGPDGRIYAIGGGLVGPTVEAYDPKTKSWTPVASMLHSRSSHAAVLRPDGRIYVLGGGVGEGGDSKSVEAYDPKTNTWTPVASMSTRHDELAATLGPDGCIYALGGLGDGGALNTVEIGCG